MTLALRPTFHESWYRVVNLRPRLRAAAQISRQYFRGERWYVVRDPSGNQFHRLSDPAYRFVGLLDGSRTVGEAWELVGGVLDDDAPTQGEVIQILSQLYSANLLETDITPDASVVLKRTKMHQQRKMQQRLMNVLFPRIPVWDPDNFIKTFMPVIRLMLSWLGAVIWLVVIIAAIAALAPLWRELGAEAKKAIDPNNWLLLGITFVVVKFIHEMGHAFSCRRFGGEVHEVGIMLLVLMPTPYVDASSAWSFQNKWKKIFVGAGGMIFELFVAAVCAFVWKYTHNSAADALIPRLAYNTMLIASVSTVLFNANPLLRYDGYYILSDFWEMPNLQRKASEYTLGLFKRHIFRVKQQQPLPTPWQRVLLFIYSIASSSYRIFVSLAIAYYLFHQLPPAVKPIGLLMGGAAIVTFAVVPVFKLTKYLAIEPELHRKRFRAIAFCSAVALALIILVGFIKFPVVVRAEGVLEASEKRNIFVESPGFCRQLMVKDGDIVQKGDLLAILEDEQLATSIKQQETQLAAYDIQIREAQASGSATFPTLLKQKEFAQQRLTLDQQKAAKLRLVAPINGQVVAPELRSMMNKYLSADPRTPFMVLADETTLKAYVLIEQGDRQKLQPIDQVKAEVRVVGAIRDVLYPIDNYIKIVPAAKKNVDSALLTHAGGGGNAPDPSDPSGKTLASQQFEAQMSLANLKNEFYPGQRVYVRMKAEKPESIALQVYNWYGQITQHANEQ